MSKEQISVRKLYARDFGQDGNFNHDTVQNSDFSDVDEISEPLSDQLKCSLLERQVANLKEQLLQANSNIGNLEQRVQYLESDLASAQEQIEQYDSSIDTLKAEYLKQLEVENQNELSQLQGRLAEESKTEIEEVLRSFDAAHRNLLKNSESTILEIAFTATTKVLGQIVASQSENYKKLLLKKIQGLISNLSSLENLKIFLPSREFYLLTNLVPEDSTLELKKKVGGIALDCFVEDCSLEAGDCIIKSSHGELELRLEKQVSQLKDTLLCLSKKRMSVKSTC